MKYKEFIIDPKFLIQLLFQKQNVNFDFLIKGTEKVTRIVHTHLTNDKLTVGVVGDFVDDDEALNFQIIQFDRSNVKENNKQEKNE